MSSRRKARVLVLQALYEIDAAGHDTEMVLDNLLSVRGLPDDNDTFVREAVRKIIQNKADIDINIRKFATAWPVEQLAFVDRNILRLAIFEILFDNSVSVKVAINEAVELAKKFGSNGSPKFINGVLGSVSHISER